MQDERLELEVLPLSVVRLIFEEGTDVSWARSIVDQRLPRIRAEIPPEFGVPVLGPITTGLGEISMFEVKNAPENENPYSLMELRTILDWEVARPLKSVPGIIEVNAFGGELKTFQARVDPHRLMARNIPINRVFQALRANNSNAGGGYLERNDEIRIVWGEGLPAGAWRTSTAWCSTPPRTARRASSATSVRPCSSRCSARGP